VNEKVLPINNKLISRSTDGRTGYRFRGGPTTAAPYYILGQAYLLKADMFRKKEFEEALKLRPDF